RGSFWAQGGRPRRSRTGGAIPERPEDRSRGLFRPRQRPERRGERSGRLRLRRQAARDNPACGAGAEIQGGRFGSRWSRPRGEGYVKVLTWDELRSGRAASPIAAAIGVFDGLHIGHRELVGRVLERGGLERTVVTFEDNPKRMLSPESFRGALSTLDQKLALIDSAGVDLCVLIDFSGDFSKLPGRQFLSMLSDSAELRYLAVGSDFRCGHNLDTGAEDIREF